MNYKTQTLVVNAEELENLRLSLGDWIDNNQKVMLDDMKDFARDERLLQLEYHERMLELYFRITSKEIELFNLATVEKQLGKKDDQNNAKAEAPAGKRYWVDGQTLLRDNRNVVQEQSAKKAKK